MKKLLYFLLTVLTCGLLSNSSCNNKATVETNDNNEPLSSVSITSMHVMSQDTLNMVQIDSIVSVDQLPEFNKWLVTGVRDGDTNKGYNYYTLYDPISGIIYTVKKIGNDEYVVLKKQSESIESNKLKNY